MPDRDELLTVAQAAAPQTDLPGQAWIRAWNAEQARRHPTVLVEDQERPLVWVGPDPDPLNPADVDAAYEQGYVDGVAHSVAIEGARKRRRDHVGIVAVLAAAAALLIVGYAAGRASAAPRSAQTTERVDLSTLSSAGPIGAPLEDSRAPSTSAALGGQTSSSGAPLSTARAGIASFVGPSYGARYLALPAGPGHLVRICARTGCVTRVSTDAGPALSMQRAGRIADLSFADFGRLCRCDPWARGLLRVTVEDLDPRLTPPPTSTKP